MDENNNINSSQEESSQGADSLIKTMKLVFIGLRILIVLLVLYIVKTGFFSVETGKQALTFRFNAIIGEKGKEAKQSGKLHWVWPKPIGKVLFFDTGVKTLEMNAFWRAEKDATLNTGPKRFDDNAKLMLGKDGYILTGDKNIFHMRCSMAYKIVDAVAWYKGYKNPEKVMKSVIQSTVIDIISSWKVDDAFYKNNKEFLLELTTSVIKNLKPLNIGIELVGNIQMKAEDKAPPENAANSFNLVSQAETEANKKTYDAQAQANNILLKAEGEKVNILTDADIYKNQIVKNVKNKSEIIKSFLREKESGRDVKSAMLAIYVTTITELYDKIKNKYIINSSADGNQEVRILINKKPPKIIDPTEGKK